MPDKNGNWSGAVPVPVKERSCRWMEGTIIARLDEGCCDPKETLYLTRILALFVHYRKSQGRQVLSDPHNNLIAGADEA